MDIEDEGASFDEATAFEPINLANSSIPIQVEDCMGPMEGQALIDTT